MAPDFASCIDDERVTAVHLQLVLALEYQAIMARLCALISHWKTSAASAWLT
jgi:hypothetical protein